MIYGYARVSTKGQARDGNSLQDQEEKLRESGAEIIFKDAFTGTEKDRPELSKLLKQLSSGDILMVCKLDRIARNAQQGLEIVQEMVNKGVTVHILNMGVLDNTPIGKCMMTMFFAFAEFERDMIVQRTQEGKAIAKMKPGYTEGRPPKEIKGFEQMYAKYRYGEISGDVAAKKLGISRSTFYRKIEKYVSKVKEDPKLYVGVIKN